MKVHGIYIYPIKGMRGIAVRSARLEQEGFEYDRRWMLVDDKGKFISQRTHPELAKFIPMIQGHDLVISYDDASFKWPLEQCTEEVISVSVFDDIMEAALVSDECSAWFSEQLGGSYRLVKVSSSTNRIKNFKSYLSDSSIESTTTVGFADGYPYLMLGTASVNLLNSKMDEDLNIDRFRANIIIRTNEPHIEDTWKNIQIGDQQLYVVKPCARCQVPTIDQKTGIKGKQPNIALASYRKDGNKVNFGMNAVSLSDGVIHIGDALTSF